MSPALSLTIGIILALAGFGMMIYAFSSSPMFKKNREKLRKKRSERENPPS